MRPGVQFPSHNEMGGHILLPTMAGPATSPIATQEGFSRAPTLTPFGGHNPGMNVKHTPTLTPQRLASSAMLPPQEQEEAMDS